MATEVALFVTCLVDQLAPEAGVAAVRLLEAAGCRVAFPEAQSCCGQPALNTGEPEAAAVLARHFVEVFEPYDTIVTPSGSCAAMVHHWYPRMLEGAWAERARVPIVAGRPEGDPAAVAFDTVQSGIARGADVVLIDTAGRLHTKGGLMAELQKMSRVVGRLIPDAPHETLLVLEAPTGMNAVVQARAFHEALGLTGVVLTKLDGTARGGTLLAIEAELGVPVKLVGMGEGIDDLNVFDPAAYLDALFAGVLDVPQPAAG